MLEGLVVWVLNNYLGKYVENLNTDQLSVALLSGKVELENLPLRKDALRHLGLPMEVRAGFIGKVQLQVPVRQIRSAPWSISIERLYVVVAPVNLDEWDSTVEATIEHERKVAVLEVAEARWRAEREAHDASYYATSYSSWLSYGTGLLANIVENMQLKINDVHIRYEDGLSSPGFACGLTVSNLSADSCDRSWSRGAAPDSEPCSYKLLQLQDLALYWEPDPDLLASADLADLQSHMSSELAPGRRVSVVSPCSAEARLRRERTPLPLRSRARPRVHCTLTGDTVALHLTNRQYKAAENSVRGLSRLAERREWRALRPAVPLAGHARAWWVYAVKCHKPDHTCEYRLPNEEQQQYSWFLPSRPAERREWRALRPAVPLAGHARAWWVYAVKCHKPDHTCEYRLPNEEQQQYSWFLPSRPAERREWRALRPAVPLAGHARAWWVYAVKCHKPDHTCEYRLPNEEQQQYSWFLPSRPAERREWRALRPAVPLAGHARAWWVYAVKCHKPDHTCEYPLPNEEQQQYSWFLPSRPAERREWRALRPAVPLAGHARAWWVYAVKCHKPDHTCEYRLPNEEQQQYSWFLPSRPAERREWRALRPAVPLAGHARAWWVYAVKCHKPDHTCEYPLPNEEQQQYSWFLPSRPAERREWRALRPAVPLAGHARAWWVYAVKCHKPDHTCEYPLPNEEQQQYSWFLPSRPAERREWRALRPAVPLAGHARAWWVYAVKCHKPDHTCEYPLPNEEQQQYSWFLPSRPAERREWRALRPAVPLAGHARAWWVYAVKCHKPDHTYMDPRPTWQSCLERARQTKTYVEVCVSLLSCPAASLAPHRKAAKDDIERKWPLHLLMALREVAQQKMPRASPASTPEQSRVAGRSMLVQWFPQWWGWYGAETAPHVEDLEEEILDVIADSLDNNTLLRRDAVFGDFQFLLNSGCLTLSEADEHHKEIVPRLELQLSDIRVGVVSRPRASALSLSLSVGDVTLRDKLTPDTLFPVLVAPQGMIREGLSSLGPHPSALPWSRQSAEPLFLLTYDTKPGGSNFDHKLYVKTQSLEVVYSPGVVRWVADLLGVGAGTGGHLGGGRGDSTKAKIMNHWEQMLQGELNERSSWQIELDVSAPQILLVEDFTDREAAVMLVDFGKMRLTNGPDHQDSVTLSDDEEMFMTPCSTPPGSPQSPCTPPAVPPSAPPLDHLQLHKRLYDTYSIELSDLQVLVGRVRDNWKFAHTKSTSSLHVLDRFTISLQAERRVVLTSDPQFPAATLCGALPTLVVHLSEHKVAAVRAVLNTFSTSSPRYSPWSSGTPARSECPSESEHSARHNSSIFMLQFAIDQMSLEVQSRGRSIAEVQVCGVRLGAGRRPRDRSLSLSVHSLLLVDALQTFGPDYELLVASHKHVGMDLASGSLLSEPTSPAGPRAPPPAPPPAPRALARAICSLAASPTYRSRCFDFERRSPEAPWSGAGWGSAGVVDSEALIAVEICFVKGDGDSKEDLRIANILFNNLDIIANQETIVELIGFTQRVIGSNTGAPNPETGDTTSSILSMAPGSEPGGHDVRTEITFDFHRLGVLLLRANTKEGALVANKIATATLTKAKIQATLDNERVSVRGSLGGVQVVSQREGAALHRRLLAVGTDCSGLQHPYGEERKALSFTVTRTVEPHTEPDAPDSVRLAVSVHVASVRYSHCPATLGELGCCGAEFAQYLSNLARSIRAAAADMAIGLMQTRSDNCQSGARADGVSPRRRAVSVGASQDSDSLADCLKSENIVLSVSVELETPVVVVPCSADSPRVFVAQLGRMTLANKGARYRMRLRDISLYTMDLTESGAEDPSLGKPVLHDTALHLSLHYSDLHDGHTLCQITGKIVGGLRVSSTREQYEQLLETVRYISVTKSSRPDRDRAADGGPGPGGPGLGPGEEADGAATLRLDPHVRAQTVVPPPEHHVRTSNTYFKVKFNLPTFTVELRGDLGGGERSLVDLSFTDFNLSYEKLQPYETYVQVSLHSVTMEDLTKDVDDKHRFLMVSHTPQAPKAIFVSKSCPDFVSAVVSAVVPAVPARARRGSLPAGLRAPCESEPAPPREPQGDSDNLVWISVHMRDPRHPLFERTYKKVSRFTKVDFNCLNLVISIDSWVVVLDFFGVSDDGAEEPEPPTARPTPDATPDATQDDTVSLHASSLSARVRSLSGALVWRGRELVRGHARGLALRGRVAGPGLRGTLGALTLSAGPGRWRDAAHSRAVSAHYVRHTPAEAAALGFTSTLTIECGDVRYVHSKRMVSELLAFLRDFSLLQRVLARRKVSAGLGRARRSRLRLSCSSVVMVVPVSARSPLALEVTLHRLAADNRFLRAGDPDTYSTRREDLEHRELLNVRSILLERASIYCVRGAVRVGPPLLSDLCTVTLQVEHNVHDNRNVPDLTIYGSLASLECRVDPSQYSVIRGVLAHNLGEDLSYINPPKPQQPTPPGTVWTLTSLKLDLQDVAVKLEPQHGISSLACINFIKSRLLVENYSDLGQDIDLVSQEILVSDTRYHREPANRRGNVFGHIVRPLPGTAHPVLAELHARRRPGSTAHTVLLTSVRLMAVLSWWDSVRHFLSRPPSPSGGDIPPPGSLLEARWSACESPAEGALEVKVNITDSQVVFVEDASVWDTNAVILKSTTVISYRSAANKPLTCSLSDVEVFSCVLGMEADTALPIVSPAAVHAEITADRVLHLQTGVLNLRLSYHDMLMFSAMLHSIPAQARTANTGCSSEPPRTAPANSVSPHARSLAAMGFSARDTSTALKMCSGSANEAALWLTAHARPQPRDKPPSAKEPSLWPLRAVKVCAESVTLCVIDDCLDSDVPLLELCLQDLLLEQDLRKVEESLEDPVLVTTPASGAPPPSPRPAGGTLVATFSADYYNRSLSGWEPVVEPWNLSIRWEYQLSSHLRPRSLQLDLSSDDMLSINVTRTLLSLVRLVMENWTKDLYTTQSSTSAEQSPKSSPSGHRRRSPFVPYALKNETGHKLWFTTLVTMSDILTEQSSELWGPVDGTWTAVRPGDTQPFCCGGGARDLCGGGARDMRRRRHQLAVRVAGWHALGPVSMDRVADYCRVAVHEKTGARVPILIQVSLEGSARKLVTLRGALLLQNRLPHPVEIRIDNAPGAEWWGSSLTRVVPPGGRWAAPLSPRAPPLRPRPLPPGPPPPPAPPLCTAPGLHHAPAHDYRFCYTSRVREFPGDIGSGVTLTLLPALRVLNLLPVELAVRAGRLPTRHVPPGDTLPLHEINVEEGVEICVRLEGFGWSTPASVLPTATSSFSARLRLQDGQARRLDLTARVHIKRNDGIKVSVSAAYWLVNKSGVPLVVGGPGGAAAGQGTEHEGARAVTPLPLSLPAPDSAPTLQARLGRALYLGPEWCSPFGLGPGTAVRRLEARGPVGGAAESVGVEVGITVRVGRGRYRHTNIVTICPRYQIHNNTSFTLHLAQKCDATAQSSSRSLLAAPGCFLPWQWGAPSAEQTLCVRLDSSAWSGGLALRGGRSLTIACKERDGSYQFLRVEVVSQGATLFAVLTDADCAPPPIRILNYSPVAIMFSQVGSSEECVSGPHSAVPWALPEPELAGSLWLRAPGGPRLRVSLAPGSAGPAALHYQNFVYIAFSASADDETLVTSDGCAASECSDNLLVLEVPMGTTKVILGKKRYGDRSQLWKRGPAGQLVHEGSSPPQQTDALRDQDAPLSPHAMVLDIEGPAPRPLAQSALRLRRSDPRRASTQTWRRDEAGRLCCGHRALCVMPEGGLFGLRPDSRAVLGLSGAGPAGWQAVREVRLRPGSGALRVAVSADGPTRLVAVADRAAPGHVLGGAPGGGAGPEWGAALRLAGLGLSLVAGGELAHLVWGGVRVAAGGGPRATALQLTARTMQWDNQLLGTPSPVLLHALSPDSELPVLLADVELTHCASDAYNAVFFKHAVVTLQPIAIRLEERLILKLWQWLGGGTAEACELPDEADYETQRMLAELTAVHATRYYFGLVRIVPSQIRLSMCTASKLERELAALKRELGLTLIRFEDAGVELQPFERTQHFETATQLARSLLKHFKDQLKWQAAKILGSVDFLGNPLGFVSDVSEGVAGLIHEGSVGALLQNIAHGISNSAAKVSESLGDGLERVVVDEAHEETRRRIRDGGQSRLLAGVRGLGLGLLGGVTSLVKHSYEGAAAEGVPGFLAGLGKGLLGTVTKPAIGVLDLAAGTAAAVRDGAGRAGRARPGRVRGPRGAPPGLLARYSGAAAEGAALLHALAARGEACLAYRALRAGPHRVRALLSDRCLRLVTPRPWPEPPAVVLETPLGRLVSCAALERGGRHYVELGVRAGGAVRRPRVQTDTAEEARWLAGHAAYACSLYADAAHTVPPDDDDA